MIPLTGRSLAGEIHRHKVERGHPGLGQGVGSQCLMDAQVQLGKEEVQGRDGAAGHTTRSQRHCTLKDC